MTELSWSETALPTGTGNISPGSGTRSLLDRFRGHLDGPVPVPAVTESGAALDYAQLAARAERLADDLAGRVEPGAVVAVCLDRCVQSVVTALALRQLDAVYLPLGADPPPARLDHILRSAGATHLLALAGRPARVTPSPPVPLDDGLALWATGVPVASTGEGAVYAVATSGSTGEPKVVTVAESALVNLVDWYTARCRITSRSRLGLAINPGFDPHLLELWSALTMGASLAVPPPDTLASPYEIVNWWDTDAVTHCILPTPLGVAVLQAPRLDPTTLEWLVVGGDVLQHRPPASFGPTVLNCYGPAEATVVTTASVVGAESDPSTAIPIGEPIDGVGVVLTGEDGSVVPRGSVGELHVYGRSLALGYTDAGQTAARFRGAALPDGTTRRVYATGDLARMDTTGVLFFEGRNDSQVKIDGVRVELGEIEEASSACTGVRRSAAFVSSGAEATRAALAVIPDSQSSFDKAALAEELRSRLPSVLVPREILVVDDLPVTANGKIDRALLGAQLSSAPDESELSPNESLVVRAYHRATGTTLSLRSRLDANGMNSITAARIIAYVEDAVGVRLKPFTVLSAEKLLDLSEALSTTTLTLRADGQRR
jgi:amino acid adenylation domain-containing protein